MFVRAKASYECAKAFCGGGELELCLCMHIFVCVCVWLTRGIV